MRKLLTKHNIFLSDGQVQNLERLIPYGQREKFLPIIQMVSDLVPVEVRARIDNLTYFYLGKVAAHKQTKPSKLLYQIIVKYLANMDGEFKHIYPILNALIDES